MNDIDTKWSHRHTHYATRTSLFSAEQIHCVVSVVGIFRLASYIFQLGVQMRYCFIQNVMNRPLVVIELT